MASRDFVLNTEPHTANVGDTTLLFQPEIMGDEFVDAYAGMRETLKREKGVDVEELDSSSPEALRAVTRSLRVFLSRLMVDESADLILRLDVVVGGATVASFDDVEEANEHAAGLKGAKVRDGLRLPDRVLLQLMEWSVELYSGGKRPNGSSGDSAKASPTGGKRGTAASRSKG